MNFCAVSPIRNSANSFAALGLGAPAATPLGPGTAKGPSAGAGHRDGAVAGKYIGDRMSLAPGIDGIAVERAGRDQPLAALEHVGHLLIALPHQDLVAGEAGM